MGEWLLKKAREYDFTVEYQDLSGGEESIISVSEDRNKLILDNKLPEDRQNLAGAVQLARYEMNIHEKSFYSIDNNNKAYSIAADMMLFSTELKPHSHMTIPDIQHIFPTASCVLIAIKLLNLKEAVLTIFYGKSVEVRLHSPEIRFPKDVTQFEIETLNKCKVHKATIKVQRMIQPPGDSDKKIQLVDCEASYFYDPIYDKEIIIMFTTVDNE